MAGLLSGLGNLGLGNLENLELFADPNAKKDENGEKKEIVVEEKDLVYDKSFTCPVCDKKITSKTIKSGKVKLNHSELDLRPVYDGVDVLKYDVIACPHCGYAALTRYFNSVTDAQQKLIKENISRAFKMNLSNNEIITYEDSLQRHQLALANAIVKRAKASEKAYICLKTAWVIRGYIEELGKSEVPEQEKIKQLQEDEKEYLKNALDGFANAFQSESYPMCGMDEMTINYLIAALAFKFEKYDLTSRLLATILTSNTANNRMKDRARDLKEVVMDDIRKKKGKA